MTTTKNGSTTIPHLQPGQIHLAGEVEAAQTWARWMTWVSLILAIVVLTALVIIWQLAMRSTVVPYAIVVDVGSMVIWHGQVGDYEKDDLWTMVFLQEQIKKIRERRDDVVHMDERRREVKQVLDGAAMSFIEAYFKLTDPNLPEQRTNPQRVQVDKFFWRPPAGDDYEVEWTEVWTPTFGHGAQTLKVSARFVVEQRHRVDPFGRPIVTIGDLNQSPLGLYITMISWIEEWQ